MKTTTIVLALVSLGVNTLSAQVAQTKPATADVTDGAAQYKEVERDAHSRVWARVSYQTNKLGQVTTSTNSYTELATGLHYRSGDNWLPSEAKIEILPNNSGAAASKGQHKAIFPPEIKSGIVELQTSDNLWLRSRIWGLAYFDGTTGQSVLIAEVKESTGQVVGDNVVIYPDAFTDVQADIRYTYTLAGFEQDVVLRQQLAGPEKFGMSEKNSRLQVLTEFVESPTPTKETRQAGGLVDQSLGWGQMSIGSGKAFSVDAVGDTTGDVPVAKEWTPLDGRNFLIEEVRYEKVADQLQKLPTTGEYNGASLQRRGTGENVIAGLKKIIPKRYAKAAPKPGTKRMAQVKPTSAPGFVMDYFILNNQANYTFGADTNYYVSGLVNLTGTTTIEGGTIVKYTNHYSAKISMSGSMVCKTDAYRPAVFTSKDDNTVGETIPGSTGNPTNYNGGTYLSGGGSATYKHLRFSYAGVGIYGYPDTGGIWHCQFFRCATAVQSADADITLRNVLFSKCGTAVSSGYGGNVVRGEHITADQLNVFYDCVSASNTGCVTNSIFTAVTNIGQYVTLYNSVTNSNGSGIYQTVGAGSYYLAENSTNRNAGTTSIHSTLANDLTNRTTYPPILLSNNFTVATVLSPQSARDTDQPDRGYHYDPIDYAVSGRAVSANLTLSGGVTLGTYGAANSYGLGLNSGSFVSEGTPTRLNWIVRYNTVQEQSTNAWSASTAGAGVQMNDSAATADVRFTAWSLLGASGTHFNDSRESMTPTAFSHSRFCGGKFTVDPSSIALTNCLWERVYVTVKSDADNVPWYVFNNSFFGGTFYYRGRGDSDLTLAFDNLFDKTTITRGTGGTSDYFTHGNNGYVGGITHLQGTSSGGDINITWPAGYQDGPLGKYYYNTSGNLNVLINADNTRNPADVGLYHYTVKKAENTKEGADSPANLDIGFHYAAVDGNGKPVDGDGDGLADYLEDTNGNGSYGTGDLADLGATDTDGDGMSDGWEWYNFGTFSRDGYGDYDNDNVPDVDEYLEGSEPNTIIFDMNFGTLRVNSNTATGTVEVIKGLPDKIAILLDNTNFTSACWINFNSNVLVNLGSTEESHHVWIGIKGRAETSWATWGDWLLTRDSTPPAVVITNPVVVALTQPTLQLQGYSIEPLSSVRYNVTNAAGAWTNVEGFVTKQWFDTNLFELTTNWFTCFDIGLTNGTNIITLRATDYAGIVSTNAYTYILDFTGDTNPPLVQVYYPLPNAEISGTSFTLHGYINDPTATVVARITDDSGEINVIKGLVERNGLFWVEPLPLASGTNTLSLTVTDAAGNVTTTNWNVIKSIVNLTIDDLAGVDLNQPFITVSGTINVSDHTVWVNGLKATLNGGGTWTVENVPVNEDGTAVIEAEAIPNSDNGGNGSGGGGGENSTLSNPGNPSSPQGKKAQTTKEKDEEVVMIHYHKNWEFNEMEWDSPFLTSDETIKIEWNLKQPGSSFFDVCWGSSSDDVYYYWWGDTRWDKLGYITSYLNQSIFGLARRGQKGEVCGVRDYSNPTHSTLSPSWINESRKGGEFRTISDGFHFWDQSVTCKALTRYELRTGGKSVPGRKSLFVLSAAAVGHANSFYPEIDPQNDISYDIPFTAIRLGDLGQLESDGLLYKALPDGETKDITPYVERRYYTYGSPSANKSKLLSQCHAPVPKDKARTTIGVGEEVDIYFDKMLQGTPIWTKTGGSLSLSSGWTTTFTAPSTKNNVTVTAKIRGAECPINFEVLEPTGIEATIRGPADFFPNPLPKVGAGMKMTVVMQPTHVSFYRVEMVEPGEPTTGRSDYFINNTPPTHNSDTGANDWHQVHYNNQIAGPPDDFFDHASDAWGWPIGVSGTYTWPIHPLWRVVGTPATHALSGWTDQVFTLSSDGTMRIDKLGHHVIRGATEPNGTVQ